MKRFVLLLSFIVLISLLVCLPSRPYINVHWTTVSEINTAGFNIYRSENPDGPFVKINPVIIPAAENSLLGGNYSFKDDVIAFEKPYYYLVEDIEINGAIDRHGPITTMARLPIDHGKLIVIAGTISTILFLASRVKSIPLKLVRISHKEELSCRLTTKSKSATPAFTGRFFWRD